MSPFLTEEEVAAATEPRTQGAARCKYLRSIGLHVEEKPNGQPLVGRAHFEEVMRGRAGAAANDGPAAGRADFAALRNRVAYGRGKKKERRQPARA